MSNLPFMTNEIMKYVLEKSVILKSVLMKLLPLSLILKSDVLQSITFCTVYCPFTFVLTLFYGRERKIITAI